MSFSITAPSITEEQERNEIAALTDKEAMVIYNDLYGSSPDSPVDDEDPKETPEFLEKQTKLLYKEMDAIESSDKQDYLDALERCPLVVQTESDPIRFLRADNYKPKAAARRLAKYWKTRKSLFGDHAFNFMRLTPDDGKTPSSDMMGEGGCALTEEEACFLQGKNEGIMLLPNDVHGRAVIFRDKRRDLFKALKRNSVLRIFWYLVHVALEDEAIQQKGFVLITNAQLASVKDFDRSYVRIQYESIRKALPMRLRAIHTCRVHSLMKMILPVYKQLIGKKLRLRHRQHNEENAVESLMPFGFRPEGMPRILGGSFSYDGWSWVSQRREAEADKHTRVLMVASQ